MLGFEIWKNGEKLAVAGLTNGGAMSLMLTWIGKDRKAAQLSEGVAIDGLDLRVGGIDSGGPSGEHSVEWIEDTGLLLGDSIEIRLVSTTDIDAPMRREPTNAVSAGVAGLRFSPCATCGAPRLIEARPAE